MKEIPLTKGQYAIVDDADYEWLMQWKWCLKTRRGESYATRGRPRKEGGGDIMMQRQIAMTPDGFETDHINHKILDNRRDNLRWATPGENRVNCLGPRRNNSSGFIGVYHSHGKWTAQFTRGGRTINLGAYTKPELAAFVRDVAAYCEHGDRATLNHPGVRQDPDETCETWLVRLLKHTEECAAANKAAEDRRDAA